MTARLAPWVTFTRLPYAGGAVLVDGSTLTAAECTETDAEFLTALLAGSRPRPRPAQRVLVADLVSRAWLIDVEEQ
ncbi:actinodefensin-associated protein B [Actinoplanes sp. NPDC051343]|uniref:actinodefensin-associated protein B n=1 Tax=Actinoplanes sp. NPDC051343 TaxID=3363906 RepID=UPI0037A28151